MNDPSSRHVPSIRMATTYESVELLLCLGIYLIVHTVLEFDALGLEMIDMSQDRNSEKPYSDIL